MAIDTSKIKTNFPNGIKIGSETPSSASDSGVTGTITWDADYIYVCVDTDTWTRVAIATW